ncbi:LamG-like jellyroll fold domain-containing protein [Saccharicrinis sp. FJH62]|uniref:LamG-like jellyroll fold domain-containing protein n=1 Tax=Saccharicrinis sp. FJH62 TaxID=3344657 RepID=UPI0035D4F8D4
MKNLILLLFICISFISYGQADITTGLIAHYSFNGDYNDATANGHNGSAVGAPEFTEGVEGQGVMFHGLETGTTDAILTDIQFAPAGSFSFSLFFKLNKFEVDAKFDNVLIGDRGEDGAGFQIRQYANAETYPDITAENGGFLCFTSRGVASDKDFDPRSGLESTEIKYPSDMPYMQPIYPDGFVHCVCIVDVENQKKQIWINKELVVDGAFTDPSVYVPANAGDFIMIGARNDGSGTQTPEEGSFNGVIDEVRIYDKALSPEEIAAIYADAGFTPVENVKMNSGDLIVAQLKGQISCQLTLDVSSEVHASIYDMTGRVVADNIFEGNAGENTFDVKTSDLNNGTYIVKVSTSDFNITRKINLK